VTGNAHHRPSLLCVEDEHEIAELVRRITTSRGYSCATVDNVASAQAALSTARFDLLLVDVNLPDGSGLTFAEGLLTNEHSPPVVMVTGVDDPAIAELVLEAGAFGYVIKPFTRSELLIAVSNALIRDRLERENRNYRETLEEQVAARTSELRTALRELEVADARLHLASQSTIEALARAIEHRDIETGRHIERMARYSEILGRRAGLPDSQCELIRMASPMHDVGKVSVPDGILFKPGPLSPEEFNVIKGHAASGRAILGKSDVPLLALAATIAESHHERWDGAGYPHGLAGTAIPLEGRIASVADVFDALVSRRVYKPRIPLDESADMIRAGRGTQFDPDVVTLFDEALDEIHTIYAEYPDP
jgi:putative two-component system response regulator